MTSSIPVFLADSTAPTNLAAAVPNPTAGDSLPDFAGLLAGAATVAPAGIPVAASTEFSPGGISPLGGTAVSDSGWVPPDSIPVEAAANGIVSVQSAFPVLPMGDTPGVGTAIGPVRLPVNVPAVGLGAGGSDVAGEVTQVPGQGIASAMVARRFAQAAGTPERAEPSAFADATEAAPASAGRTRAEEEQAMALLAGLFPALPAAPLPGAPIMLAVAEQPTPTGTPVSAPGMADDSGEAVPERASAMGTEMPVDHPGRAGYFGRPKLGLNPSAPAPFGLPVVTARSAAGLESANGSNPKVGWSARGENSADQSADTRSNRPVASAPADPLSGTLPISEIPMDIAGTSAMAAAAPAGTGDPSTHACTVIDALAVRPDGMRLARRSAIAASTPGSITKVENSAGDTATISSAEEHEIRGSGKKLLRSFEQGLADGTPDSGTTAANSASTMNPRPHISFAAPAQGRGTETILAESASRPSEAQTGREAAELAAPRVVSTILEVVDAQEASRLRPAPAVHLRMQVAGETVGIKVELRDDAVQTRFTTVSPELREALTREWQSARNETREGGPRLLDPVFNTISSSGGSASPGHDAASQQQQQARAWGSPWEHSGNPSARRARQASAPAATPATAPETDSRLLSAIA